MILVDKYKSYIYGGHLSLDELIATVPTNTNDYQKKRAQVIRELKYLIDNNILNGVIFNEVDNKLALDNFLFLLVRITFVNLFFISFIFCFNNL